MNGKSPYQAKVRHSKATSPYTIKPLGGVRRVELAIEAEWRRPRLRSRKRGGGAATP